MGFLVHPWFLVLFAVAAFFVFRALGAGENHKGAARVMPPFTPWVILGISVVLTAFLVLKILEDRKLNPFRSQAEHPPVAMQSSPRERLN